MPAPDPDMGLPSETSTSSHKNSLEYHPTEADRLLDSKALGWTSGLGDAHLFVHRLASEQHPAEQGLDVAQLHICACSTLQSLLDACLQIQCVRLQCHYSKPSSHILAALLPKV